MTVAVLFDNFGPYHFARLRGAAEILQQDKLLGLQVRARSHDYDWQSANDVPIPLQTIFPAEQGPGSVGSRTREVWRCVDTLAPDAIAIAGYAAPEMLAALAWCRRRRRVAVLLSESKADDTSRSFWREQVKGMVVRRYDAAIVGGHPQRRYLETLDFPSAGIFSGYDVVDNAAYHPNRICKLPRPIERPYFLMANRFVAKKNLDFSLECYAEYRRRMAARSETPWDLVLAGDGPLRSDLCRLASALSLDEHVHFPGFLQQDELLPYFAHCSVFVHASTVEQWGLVVNEAMAAGRPVFVSHACGCFEDLIEEGRTGMGFDPANREELVQLMVQATSGELPLASLGSAALGHIDNFTPHHFGLALKQAIEYGTQRSSSRSKLR